MRTVAGMGWEASSGRVPAALAAVVTTLGLSLSIAAPEATGRDGHTGPGAASAAGAQGTAVVDATIGGLASRRPRLNLEIQTYGTFLVTAVKLALPRGLTFHTGTANLRGGVKIAGDKSRSTVRRGELTVTLRHPSTSLEVMVGPAAVSESPSLAHAVRKVIAFNESHPGGQRSLPLKLTLTVESGRHAAIEVPETIPFR